MISDRAYNTLSFIGVITLILLFLAAIDQKIYHECRAHGASVYYCIMQMK